MANERAGERNARVRILSAAGRLFYERGIRAVGVEAVVETAGVTKMSLYRHFASKDELAARCLEERIAGFWRWFDGELAAHEGDAAAGILALFESLARRATSTGFRGCPMTNAAVEFPEPDHPARRLAEAHKRELHHRLVGLAAMTGATDPARPRRRPRPPDRGRLRLQPDLRRRRPGRPGAGSGRGALARARLRGWPRLRERPTVVRV